MKKLITILVPCYNEAANIRRMVEKLSTILRGKYTIRLGAEETAEVDMDAFDWELLFVNDGSRDSTLKELELARRADKRVNYLNLSRNFGKENAMMAGMDFAKGDAVVIMDADLQHPPEVIPEMVYWWLEGYDDVYGVRATRGRESWLRKHFSLAFYKLLQSSTRIEILQNVGDFRLLSRRCVAAIVAMRESQRYTKGLYSWVGYNKKGVVFEQAGREAGKSSFNFRGLMNLAVEGITCFTTSPLRISTLIGLVVSFLSLAYMVYIIVKTIFFGEVVQGFPTIMCAILLLGGLQLLAIGIMGEYIARIFNESKRRPPYIVESKNGDPEQGSF